MGTQHGSAGSVRRPCAERGRCLVAKEAVLEAWPHLQINVEGCSTFPVGVKRPTTSSGEYNPHVPAACLFVASASRRGSSLSKKHFDVQLPSHHAPKRLTASALEQTWLFYIG